MSPPDETPKPTLFQPRNDPNRFDEHFDRIPRFLFRTWSPRSKGTTASTCVKSEAAKHKCPTTDILQLENITIAGKKLENHLCWEKKTSNLVSWTSSFIFAIQHAIRMTTGARYQTPSEPSEIRIAILDTRSVPRGSLLPAVALLEAFDIRSCGKLRHDYYYGEYLSQGCMDLSENRMSTMTLQVLIDHGLYDVYPAFAVEREKESLCKRVRFLRSLFRDSPKVPTREELSKVEAIANFCCESDRMRAVIMVALLSLKPRGKSDSMILKAFRRTGLGELKTVLEPTHPC
jgi:hypothetical protein